MSRVLVISHEASLSGAPRVAALVMSCLREQGHSVRAVSRHPGPLLDELTAAAPTTIEPLRPLRRRLWSLGGAAGRLAALLDMLVAAGIILRAGPEVVYVNSTAAAAYLRPAAWLRRPIVLHVHESKAVITGFLRSYGVKDLTGLGGRRGITMVACSPSVAAELLALGAPPQVVRLVVSVPDDAPSVNSNDVPPELRKDGVVVGACGVIEPRKGVDLWLQVASAVFGDVPNASFVWVGGGTPPPEAARLPCVEFTGATSTPLEMMARFDVMTLPSRDDPFPLVVIEAMRLGKPIVAFAVGGVRDQVGDAAMVVPAGDVDAFAQAVCTLAQSPGLREELGQRARTRAATLFSRESFAQGIQQVMETNAQPLRQEEPCM